ncbi:Lipoprotein activator of PBP from the outer membrane A [Anaerobiospirillum thomasii]|nr:Lipoprotein activator of PBP from the outer membrane A [Anaerobiospirillum thomasii]
MRFVVKSYSKKFKLSIVALAMCASLSGCVSNLTEPEVSISTAKAFSQLNPNENYVDLASRADEQSQFAALILKTRYYAVNNDLTAARQTIDELLTKAITPLQQDQIMIMQSLVYSLSGQYTKGLDTMDKVNTLSLPKQVAVYYYQLFSNLAISQYKQSKDNSYLIKGFNAQKDLYNFVDGTQKNSVLKKAVSILNMLDAQTLTELATTSDDMLEKGYYEYALINSSRTTNLKQQLFASWATTYADHPLTAINSAPAATDSKEPVQMTQSASAVAPLADGKRVAVLVPLTGRFAKNVGEPAKLGVIAALQDREAKVYVDLYDTNIMSMQEIMAKLKTNGTSYIIGPVLKPEVEALVAASNSITTIAMNEPGTYNANMYYFDLGPDYEATNAAAKIFSDGYKKPLLITNNSSRAERVIEGFNRTFASTGNSLANTCRFNNQESAKADLGTCAYNQADSVYINASSREANVIKAMLPSKMPVYLSSESYDGLNNTGLEIALNGATIGQMPWLITDSQLKASATKNMPKADTLTLQIFAAAYDAINVAFNLDKLTSSKEDLLHGLTGDIIVGDKNLLERSLMWYKIGSDVKGRF